MSTDLRPGLWKRAEEFADVLGVSRDRVYGWRKSGAPHLLDGHQWLAWLTQPTQQRRQKMRLACARLRAHMESIAAETGDTLIFAPEETPAAQGSGGEGLEGEDWKTRGERARALRAEMELAAAEGRAIPRDDAAAQMRAMAAVVIEIQTRGLWHDLLPALDGASPDLRRGLRRAHDAAVLRQRHRIAEAVRAATANLGRGAIG